MITAAGWDDVKSASRTGVAEALGGAQHWRVWHLLGTRELHQRYARSKLGQFWLLLSTAMIIVAMAIVWSTLYNQPLRELMPFIGIGIIIWNYFSQVLLDCTTVFTLHGNFYRNQKMNFAVSIYAVVYKNTIIFAHSLTIIVGLILVFGVPINWYDFQLVPGLILTWITMLWSGYIIAMLCVRYRDIVQLINTWLFVLFFITPVLWKPDFLATEYRFLANYNPLAQFMELLRNPFLGQPVDSNTWLITSIIAIGGGLLACPLIGRYRRRVIFWA